MNRLIYFIALFLFFTSCNQQGKIKISGEIENGAGKTLYFEKVDVNRTITVDSLKIKSNNGFTFKAKSLPYPAFYNLKISDRNFITLLVEPDEKVELQADFSDLLATANISGSPGSVALQKVNMQLRNTLTQLFAMVQAEEKTIDAAEKEKIGNEIDQLLRDQRRFSIGFILENMESLASITALYQKYDDQNWVLDELRDLQYLKIVSESLSKIWPESPHVQALAKDSEAKLAEYNLALLLATAEKSGQVISNYPDLSLPNPEGDTLKISSLKSRFILVLFSASWDNKSVEHDLAFKPVYEAFKKKGFDIYQVSLERNTQEWFRSISFNEFNWNHVSELTLLNSQAAGIYNVTSLPANFLIDKQSGIVAKDITPRELNRRLLAIFN